MIHLPFINKYPYTSFEAVNIDWLLNQVSKIPVLVEKVNEHETRIGTLEETAADHEERITAAEGDIDSLEGRMDDAEGRLDTAEGKISDLETDMGAAQDDITDLKSRMQSAEGDIDSLEGRMDTAEDNIGSILIKDQAQDNDIEALDSRVDTLEGKEVVANPGGTGATLNTLGVAGVTYVIPSGGGGGGGSTVTPNPAGVLPTDPELSALGIDALNYRIPVTASDKAAIEGDISDLQDAVDDLEAAVLDIDTRIGTVINKNLSALNINPSLSTGDVIELTGSGGVPVDQTITLSPGVYQVSYSCDFDTTNYGSTPRFLGCYIRNASTHANLSRGKFSVFGTERAMITQAASLQCMTIVTVPEGTTLSLVPGIRCNSSKDRTGFAITDSEFAAVRLGVVS